MRWSVRGIVAGSGNRRAAAMPHPRRRPPEAAAAAAAAAACAVACASLSSEGASLDCGGGGTDSGEFERQTRLFSGVPSEELASSATLSLPGMAMGALDGCEYASYCSCCCCSCTCCCCCCCC